MIKAIDIQAALSGRPFLDGRGAATEADAADTFAELARFRDGGVFAGSFSGASPWERHGNGDELVHVLAGTAQLTILSDDGPETLASQAGMIAVVPQGLWHRFEAPDGVTLLTATPQPTEHSFADDPRGAA